MRVKNGKLKLDAGEKRVGNFVVKDEATHMKVMDINQVFTHRADKRTPIGQFLSQCFEVLGTDESTGKGLGNWLAVVFTAFSAVPDVQFLEEVMKASTDCMERHPEAYGAPAEPVSDEEDQKIIEEERDLAQFVEDVKNMPDEAPSQDAADQ